VRLWKIYDSLELLTVILIEMVLTDKYVCSCYFILWISSDWLSMGCLIFPHISFYICIILKQLFLIRWSLCLKSWLLKEIFI